MTSKETIENLKGLGVIMKKTLLIVAISLLLVSGYVVGQSQFDSQNGKSELTVKRNNLFSETAETYMSSKAPDSGKIDPSYSTTDELGVTSNSGCSLSDDGVGCANPDVMAPEPSPNPNVGNPKGTKIIKTGTVDIEIKRGEVTEKFDLIVALIPEGGYIENSQTALRTSTVTVRIPSEELDETLVALRKIGKITSESINSVDRSFDSISYDSSLKILAQKEAALNALLAKAKEVYEIENIQNQLFNVRQEIETTQGMKNLLDEQVALSTLTITIAEKGVKSESDKDGSILGDAWKTSSKAILVTIGGMMIVLSSAFPFLVLAALVIYTFKAIRKRKVETHKAKADKDNQTTEE